MSRSGYPHIGKLTDFAGLISALENVTERSESDIRSWEKSRIVTERITAATNVTERCGLIEPLRKKRSADIFSLRTRP